MMHDGVHVFPTLTHQADADTALDTCAWVASNYMDTTGDMLGSMIWELMLE